MRNPKKTGFFFLASGGVTLISQVYRFNWDVTIDQKIWTVAWFGVALVLMLAGIGMMRKRDG